MEKETVIEILEALASGFSPITGEEIATDSVLNERNVIRALQIAIDELKLKADIINKEFPISNLELTDTITTFLELELNPTTTRLTNFFLGLKRFDCQEINEHKLFGKYNGKVSKGVLTDHLTEFLKQLPKRKKSKEDLPWANIDFFQKETFNNLSEKAINQLQQKIDSIEIVKTDNISEYIQNARLQYPRAYEPWSESEKELLSKAMKYTNDLDLLTCCFKRGKGSIESCGKRILFEKAENETKPAANKPQ
ncbi:hypothetical protein [Carboxylicivirga taeanensis]|uniref:hypothetical protein n=1 Tax=Carboxylicivirga taeanensis TaxID=1416875 RepID=UPI003F6DC722